MMISAQTSRNPEIQTTLAYIDINTITLPTAVGAVPTIIGTTQAIEHGQRQNARKQHRGRRCNLVITLPRKSSYSALFEGAKVVLKNNKLESEPNASGHLFSGFYLAHPVHQEEWAREGFRGEGLVSTIRDSPPDLNWIYVNRETSEVKYGSRTESAGHLLGPWDCTERERRLTFEGWEGFLAVEDEPEDHPGVWALYFDRRNDGLEGRVSRSVAVLISRREPTRSMELRDEEDGKARRRHENE